MEIKSAIDGERLLVSDEEPLAAVQEYTRDDSDTSGEYRIRDVLGVLHAQGRITDQRHTELLTLGHRPQRADETHPQLRAGQRITVQLLTLQTLAQHNLLWPLIEMFQVRITSSDHTELLAELRGFTAQEEAWRWHKELWDTIRADPHFVEVATMAPSEWKEEAADPVVNVSLAAVMTAQKAEVALLADDRLFQVLLFNERSTDEFAAFGADKLVLALRAGGLLDEEKAADALFQLTSWRYRFIVMPPEVLKTLADRFAQHPPGDLLRKVALYVHDCMRDPGLFGGTEAVEPPISMAGLFFLRWAAHIGEFLVNVWADPSWDEAHARSLTEWAMTELLPSPPRALSGPGTAIATLGGKMAMRRALIRACQVKDTARGNSALRAIAQGLGMTETELLAVVAEGIDGI